MTISKLSRRSLILCTFALAACETTGADGTPTTAYDGEYEIVVSRLWNPTPTNLRDPHYQTGPEELAFLWANVENGGFKLNRVEDKTPGSNYKDFSATFYEGGLLDLRVTVGYIVKKRTTHKLRIKKRIGSQLLGRNWVKFEPDSGFDAQYRPHISIRKVS